jgi:DNA-binding XRE family transcriptional regulator
VPRVAVEDHAFRDPRVGALATATPLRRASEALCRLVELWSHVTKTQRPVQPQRVVGYALGLKRMEHVRVLVEVGLALESGESGAGLLDLSPLSELFGDWEWYGEERARAGGIARAAEADRDGGKFQSKYDWGAELLAALGDGQPRHVAELAQAFGVQRRTIREQLRKLGQAVLYTGDGMWQCAGPAHSPAHGEALEPAPGDALDQRTPSATSAPPPSLALSPPLSTHANARSRESWVSFAEAREGLGLACGEAAKALGLAEDELAALEAGEREPSSAETYELEQLLRRARGELRASLDEQRLVLRSERRAIAKALWECQDRVRRRVVPGASPLKCQDLPGGPLDHITLLLATWSPADCVHALEMAGIEAEVRRAAGEDPLMYLNGRTNWKLEQFERLVQSTPDQIRARASPSKSKRTRPATTTSLAPAAPEEWRALAGRRGD